MLFVITQMSKTQAPSITVKLKNRGDPDQIVATAQRRARNNNRDALLEVSDRQPDEPPLPSYQSGQENCQPTLAHPQFRQSRSG